MTKITSKDMIDKAKSVIRTRTIANGCTVGNVGCALLTEGGNIYLGVCLDVGSGIGFCAEHSAIAAMVTAGEHKINKIVAVLENGDILPPCGRCREFIRQIDIGNLESTQIILGENKIVPLKELLPYP